MLFYISQSQWGIQQLYCLLIETVRNILILLHGEFYFEHFYWFFTFCKVNEGVNVLLKWHIFQPGTIFLNCSSLNFSIDFNILVKQILFISRGTRGTSNTAWQLGGIAVQRKKYTKTDHTNNCFTKHLQNKLYLLNLSVLIWVFWQLSFLYHLLIVCEIGEFCYINSNYIIAYNVTLLVV